jgi:YNFM family putative membrane transporter
VTTLVTRAVLAHRDLAAVLVPRDGVVAERLVTDDGGVTFEQAEGPLAWYRRRVQVTPAAGGRVEVRQVVDVSVGVPGFSWLFALPVRRHLARLGPLPRSPWWAPPARLPRPAAITVAALCLLSMVVGYVTDLLGDTMTYAASDFRVGTTGQGVALGVVEAGAVVSLAILHAGDRRGRRRVLMAALAASCALSALSAAAPSLAVLTALQLGSASLVGAAAVLIGVIAVEEVPAGSRAWAVGLIGMAFGLGSGATLAVLPLADLGRAGWRWPYAIALVGVPLALRWARHLPEAAPAPPAGRRRPLPGLWRRRLLVLGAGALLLAVFTSPASGFQNHYLHVERHLSATRISLLEQLSGTIGGLGTLVGGRLADTWGRRPVAAIGVAAGTAITLAHYTSAGTWLWVWNTLGSLVAYAVAPALAVYGAELFPAAVRARAGGVLTVLAAAGGALGLGVAGAASSALGGTAAALAILAVAPAAVVVLILVAYPETARVPLEELNPDGPVEELPVPA